MFRSVSRVFSRVVKAGRIGRKRSFVAALGVAMLLLPVSEALAFFAASGSGTVGPRPSWVDNLSRRNHHAS
jgi:hypothetical protein